MEYALIFGALALFFFYRAGLRAEKEKQKPQAPEKSLARKPGPPILRIKYVDADGAFTGRDITPYKSGVTRKSMQAYCHMRNDRREFFLSVFNQPSTFIPARS